jgi:putative heme degradation protein
MNHEDQPFSRGDSGPGRGATHPDPLTAQLLEAAAPGNAQRQGECCAIRLWREWAQMLETLPALGEVLVVTRNPGAILGERRIYPEMAFEERFRWGRSVDGAFDAEFIPWSAGAVVCHHHADGSGHSAEFRDEAGEVLHKVCLTNESRRDRFVDWVEHHQAIPEGANPEASFTSSRWRTVQQRHWFDYDEIEDLPGGALEDVFRFAIERQAAVRVIVGNEGMVHAADFAPRCLHPRQEWMFASDDEVGLHFDPAGLTGHILHDIPAGPERPAGLTLKSFSDDGSLGLVLAAPSESTESEWAEFLRLAVRDL